MLDTDKKNFHIEVNDSTVSIFSGVARIGNALINYSGGQTTFANMLSFSGQTNRYQNILLYLTDATATVSGELPLTTGAAYLTKSVSPPVATKRELTIPSMLVDAGFPDPSYARGFPLGVFMLYSTDGTQGTLQSYYTI